MLFSGELYKKAGLIAGRFFKPLCNLKQLFKQFKQLLFCRFHDPWFGKYFDGDPSTGQMQEYSPLPVLHIHLMRLWTAWLEKYPEEFVDNPVIAVSVCYNLLYNLLTTDLLNKVVHY